MSAAALYLVMTKLSAMVFSPSSASAMVSLVELDTKRKSAGKSGLFRPGLESALPSEWRPVAAGYSVILVRERKACKTGHGACTLGPEESDPRDRSSGLVSESTSLLFY